MNDLLNVTEQEVLIEHLAETNGTDLDEHIRAGGTFHSFATAWKSARDEAAEAKGITDETARAVLACPLGDHDLFDRDATIRDYLIELLLHFWSGGANTKYGMTGGSDWRYDLYGPMNKAGLIPGWIHGYGVGYREASIGEPSHPEDQTRADALIAAAIRLL